MLNPPLAFSANLVDEQPEKDLGKLEAQVEAEKLEQQMVVGNTRLCLHLAANLTRGNAPKQSDDKILDVAEN